MSALNMPRRVVVVSVDGLSSIDLPRLRELPHFRQLMETGSRCREMRGIYPTQTYPLHASMITGTFSLRHGITSNTLFQPGRTSPDWHWYRKFIKVPTLYDIARKAGWRTATLLWPSAGRSKNHYVIPEIKRTRPGQSFLWLIASGGTPLFILHMALRYRSLLKGLSYYHLDNLTSAVASYLIGKRRTELLLLHLLDLDGTRHVHGFRSDEAQKVLEEQDRRLGKILAASHQSGTYPETVFVVFGDHAYIDIHTRIRINAAFRQAGLLRFDSRGKLTDWRAWAVCCEGSAQVVLKSPADSDARRKVEEVFHELQNGPASVIETVYDKEQVLAMKVSDHIDYILEARAGFYFVPNTEGEVCAAAEAGFRAVHGYHPDRQGYSSVFLAAGPGIRKGLQIEAMRILDIGPTLAALMGLNMPGVDGRVLNEMLTKH